MKKCFKTSLIFTMCMGIIFTSTFSLKANAKSLGSNESIITPQATVYCLVTGGKHTPDNRYLVKVKFDGNPTMYNYTRAICPCGEDVFYDGAPQGAGYVGQYFYSYYDYYIDYSTGLMIYLSRGLSGTNYSSPYLTDWDLSRNWVNYSPILDTDTAK